MGIKNIILLWFVVCVTLVKASGSPLSEDLKHELTEKALMSRLKVIAGAQSKGTQQFYFLSAERKIEEAVLAKCNYDWLKASDQFEADRQGSFRLKKDHSKFGCVLGVSEFEQTKGGWRCILVQHCGPLGESCLRCYFKVINGEWMVERIVIDDELPVS